MWPIRIGCINPKGQIPKLSMMAMQSLSGEDYYFMCMEIFCRGLARKGQVSMAIKSCSRRQLTLILQLLISSFFLIYHIWGTLQLGILLCLREGASSTDIILGMLQVRRDFLRKLFLQLYICKYHYIFKFSRSVSGWKEVLLDCICSPHSIDELLYDQIIAVLQACYVRKALQLSSWWMNMVVAGDVSDLVLNEWFKLNEDSKQCAKRDMCLLNEQMSGLGWAMKNILLSTQERVQYSFVDD